MTPERWQRVKQVFQSALDRPPAERDLWLAEETTGDPDLRREVESMLRHSDGPGVLDRPACEGLRLERVLEPGMRLGPYEILQPAGAGGMGRVYKAVDTRLGRLVAIKVLSAEFSHQLRIEARAISALNHPHVCALYDIGDDHGAAYLVMEYLAGESLAVRLARGPLSIDDALLYSGQIANALAAAHEAGIVHRDIKPANIMITPSGAKVLDFGVARTPQDDSPCSGGLAGTAAYMSPSQLNGNPADARSDIFAFGLVLYEMLTATRYSRGSPKRPTDAPPELARLVEQCLCEDAAGRVQSMEEVRRALDLLRNPAPIAAPQSRWLQILRTPALSAAVAALCVLVWNLTRPVPQLSPPTPPRAVPVQSPPPARATEAPPHARTAPVSPRSPPLPPALTTLASYPGSERDPTFSPDGSRVAFSWHGRHRGYGIYVRPVQSDAPPMQLTDGSGEDWGPAWSPDGRDIAFRRRSKSGWGIYLVPSDGGPERLLAAIAPQNQETLPQMSWSRDGRWIAAPDRDSSGATQIYLFATATGERRPLTANSTGIDHAPAFSPDGKSLAYASCIATIFPCDIYAIDLNRDYSPKSLRRLTNESMYLRGIAWLPDGRDLVYSAGRTFSDQTYLWRVSAIRPGEPKRIEMAGARARHPAISPVGGLLAFTNLGGWHLMTIQNFR